MLRRLNTQRDRCRIANKDLLSVLLAFADEEDDADDDADKGEGTENTADNSTGWWAWGDLLPLFFSGRHREAEERARERKERRVYYQLI